MGNDNEFNSCDEEQGADEVDADVPQNEERLSRYQMRGPTFQATVTVRQLPSKGISFQVWPAANAVCWYIEHVFGGRGKWIPGPVINDGRSSSTLQRDVASGLSGSTVLERDAVLSGNLLSVLGRELALVDNFSSRPESDLALMDRIYSVIEGDEDVSDSFGSTGRQTRNSRDESEAEPLKNQSIRGLSGRESGTQTDLARGSFKPNCGQARSSSQNCEAQTMNDLGTSVSVGKEVPTRREVAHIDNFSSSPQHDLAFADRICSVIEEDEAVGVSFGPTGRQTENSRDGSEAQPLSTHRERRFAVKESGGQTDPALGNSKSNCRQAKSSSQICEAQAMNIDIGTLVSAGKEAPTRRSMRILELGSGTGMVGIVAACLGAHVVLTDLPHVIPNISHNLDLNREIIEAAGGSVEAKVLRWGVEEDVKALGDLSFDLILASDCVYHDTIFKPFLETLKWLMAGDRTHISKEHCKPKISSGLSSAFPTLTLSSDFCSPPLPLLTCLNSFPDPIHPEVKGKVSGNQPTSQSEIVGRNGPSKPGLGSDLRNGEEQGSSSTDCVILLGHMRRWKKDSHFFRIASKCFDVEVVHRHPPEENARIGPIVYRLSTKSNTKFSSKRSSDTSQPRC